MNPMDFCGCGFSFGSLLVIIGAMLAVLVCWSRTNSILVSTLAGVFGWFYLIYYAVIIRPREAAEEGEIE